VFLFSSFIINFKKIYANYGKASDNAYHKVYSNMLNQHKHLLQTDSLVSAEVKFEGKFEFEGNLKWPLDHFQERRL
jgi:hypothetical protein